VFHVGGKMRVGWYNYGEFNQTGGSARVGVVHIGAHGTVAQGVYNLSGGTLVCPGWEADNTYIGEYCAGTFNQTGGSVYFGMLVEIGYSTASDGLYTLSGGTCEAGGTVEVGDQGKGVLELLGGTFDGVDVIVGDHSGPGGTVGVSGGLMTLAGTMVVGDQGSGEVYLEGGTFDGHDMIIAAQSGAEGTVEVSRAVSATLSGDLTMSSSGDARMRFLVDLDTDDEYLTVGGSATLCNVIDVAIDALPSSPADKDDFWPLILANGAVSSTAALEFSGSCSWNAYAFELLMKEIGADEVLCLVLSQPHPGDVNLDGAVNVGDLGIIAFNWGGTGKVWTTGDIANEDGLVNAGDYGVLAANWGWTLNQQRGGGGGGEEIDWDVNKNGQLDEEDAEAIFDSLLK